ncbi:MAG: oligosaccharide flippase family protein [Prevotellaceae bacterium]|nr:oligosaccharide flippase family protein [Candidatus Colivivens equi]
MKKDNLGMNKISKILSNKVFLYMGTRYLTYAIQFCTTLIIAIKLGPTDFGIWSFFLLVIGFFNIVDFGVSNSLNVLLVQSKDDHDLCDRYISSASTLIFILGLILLIITLFTGHGHIALFEKYAVGELIPFIFLIVVLAYYNKAYSTVYRVGNRLLEVAIYQSLIPLLLFAVILAFRVNALKFMVGAYLVGNIIIIGFFIKRGLIPPYVKPHKDDIKNLFTKGFWLFLYNSAFYLIMYTTSLYVSKYYFVEEYGKFNFAYTLSNSIFLLVDAFGFIVFPKMIDRLRSNDYTLCREVITSVRENYMTLIYTLVFVALPFFELFCSFIPKYSECGRALCISAVSLLPYSNAFGLNTFLIAQNKEKALSVVSLFVLMGNVALLLLLRHVFNIPYDLFFLFPAFSYLIYTAGCAYLSIAKMGEKKNILEILLLAFPVHSGIPFVISIVSIFLSYRFNLIILLCLPVISYILLNMRNVGVVLGTVKSIINRPNIVDL